MTSALSDSELTAGESTQTEFIPWKDFKPFLSAKGTAIFGGNRPDSDTPFLLFRADTYCELFEEED